MLRRQLGPVTALLLAAATAAHAEQFYVQLEFEGNGNDPYLVGELGWVPGTGEVEVKEAWILEGTEMTVVPIDHDPIGHQGGPQAGYIDIRLQVVQQTDMLLMSAFPTGFKSADEAPFAGFAALLTPDNAGDWAPAYFVPWFDVETAIAETDQLDCVALPDAEVFTLNADGSCTFSIEIEGDGLLKLKVQCKGEDGCWYIATLPNNDGGGPGNHYHVVQLPSGGIIFIPP